MEQDKKYLTREEFAKEAGVKPLTIRHYEKINKIQVDHYIGNKPRYLVAELEKLRTKNPV